MVDANLIINWVCEYLHCDPESQQGVKIGKFINEKIRAVQKVEEKYQYHDLIVDCEDA